MRKLLEKDIQQAISDYLCARKIVHWRQNSGAMTGKHKAKKRFFRFMAWLWPRSTEIEEYAFLDIGGILPDGRYFTIEVKKPGEEPTEAQRNTINMIKNVNAIALWTDDIDEIMYEFEKIIEKNRI